MFIDKDKYKTIPVGLNGLILKYDIKWGEMAAGKTVLGKSVAGVSRKMGEDTHKGKRREEGTGDL